jgi:hypothetical protein
MLRVVVQLIQRQAARVEEIEDGLLDDLGETEEQRSVDLDAGGAGLDLEVFG